MNDSTQKPQSWTKLLNRYHWFVLIVSALGWLFDCLDQQLFNLARGGAMKALLQDGQDAKAYGGYATSIFLIGWATGGLIFGMLGDYIGRAKTMMLTILIYSLCTGLSALSQNFLHFAIFRFLTGLGVGGEFAVGVALVAEVMPAQARAGALGLLQSLSTVGNIIAAFIGIGMPMLESGGFIAPGNSWRWMFVIGALPAMLALVIRSRMKEPEQWQRLKDSGAIRDAGMFTYGRLFADKRWSRNALVGMLMACAGVIGIWGIGFFSPEMIRDALETSFKAAGVAPDQIGPLKDRWASIGMLIFQVGGFCGMMTMTVLCQKWGRKPTFVFACITAMIATIVQFHFIQTKGDLWLQFVAGFFQLGIFAIYAIYLPELFPTELRSTGTSFCYNVGRFIAALGPALLGALNVYYKNAGFEEPFRLAAITMSSVYLLGLIVVPFAPETKDKPLPENERGFAH
jgi:MFS family permease